MNAVQGMKGAAGAAGRAVKAAAAAAAAALIRRQRLEGHMAKLPQAAFPTKKLIDLPTGEVKVKWHRPKISLRQLADMKKEARRGGIPWPLEEKKKDPNYSADKVCAHTTSLFLSVTRHKPFR